MPRWLALRLLFSLLAACTTLTPASSLAQMGMGGGGGGVPGAPAGLQKPKFRDHLNQTGGLRVRREKGDSVVAGVAIRGNRVIGTERITQLLETRAERVFDPETVLSDVRKLNEFGAFDSVRYKIEDRSEGKWVTFIVSELPTISAVHFHGNRAMNDRELQGRAGLEPKDPLSEFAIESALRRIRDYYLEKGFNQVSIETVMGVEGDPRAVVFRINEGPLERIAKIKMVGNTISSEARLKKIVQSRDTFMKVGSYIGNTAKLREIDADVDRLTLYYRNLGFLTAQVSRQIEYDESGKWLTVTFVIVEGDRFAVNSLQFVGNRFVETPELRQRMELQVGESFSGTTLQLDVNEIVYGYGSLGFIYADVETKLSMVAGEENKVDVIFQIEEGDRWKIGRILAQIEGEPHLIQETYLLNQIDLVEGQYFDRRKLETNRRRLTNLQVFENNPSIADPPDIKVVPRDEAFEY